MTKSEAWINECNTTVRMVIITMLTHWLRCWRKHCFIKEDYEDWVFLLFTFIFLTTVLSQWDFSHGKFGFPFPGKAGCDRVALPNLGRMLGVLVFPNPPNPDIDYGIFNLRTDVNACDCARGCADTVRESALKVDSGRKIPCRTGESNRRRWRAGPMIY